MHRRVGVENGRVGLLPSRKQCQELSLSQMSRVAAASRAYIWAITLSIASGWSSSELLRPRVGLVCDVQLQLVWEK